MSLEKNENAEQQKRQELAIKLKAHILKEFEKRISLDVERKVILDLLLVILTDSLLVSFVSPEVISEIKSLYSIVKDNDIDYAADEGEPDGL